MLYRTKPQIVEALVLTHEIRLLAGAVGTPGQWMVFLPDGSLTFLDDAAFKEAYEIAEDEDVPTRFHAAPKRKNAGKPRPRRPVASSATQAGLPARDTQTDTNGPADPPQPDESP